MSRVLPRCVTYSPALTIVPTYECFNRCTYCNFRREVGQSPWLSLAEAQQRLEAAQSQPVIEILVLSGEVHPQSPRRQAWVQHLYDLCALALDKGFLPHTNAGPLAEAEMEKLRSVNVSMGLMLEQVTPTLLNSVHHHAPSKVPALRLQQLEQAGRLGIPFTTGLLLGLGESDADRIETLTAIAAAHRRWGHIQEVILQPHQPGQRQAGQAPPFSAECLVRWVQIARQCLPADITLQVPPNLLQTPTNILSAIAKGARDLGGIGPLDEVNPDYPHPTIPYLSELLGEAGWSLRPRLPVYPQYETWLSPTLQQAVQQWHQRLAQGQLSITSQEEVVNARGG